MSPKKNTMRPSASVVATAHTLRGLREARRLRRGAVGWVELRLDALANSVAAVERTVPHIDLPLLLTARHGAEGGLGQLGVAHRRELLERFLFRADAIDIELRSVPSMTGLLEDAGRRRIRRIISFHDFHCTPSLPRLRQTVLRAGRAGADVVKIATRLRKAADLAVLLVLQGASKIPLATMGMGPLGKVSRLALAAAGSRLNYGYLDKPQVPAQWPALQLVRVLEEVRP